MFDERVLTRGLCSKKKTENDADDYKRHEDDAPSKHLLCLHVLVGVKYIHTYLHIYVIYAYGYISTYIPQIHTGTSCANARRTCAYRCKHTSQALRRQDQGRISSDHLRLHLRIRAYIDVLHICRCSSVAIYAPLPRPRNPPLPPGLLPPRKPPPPRAPGLKPPRPPLPGGPPRPRGAPLPRGAPPPLPPPRAPPLGGGLVKRSRGNSLIGLM
mmetsp:Transcript_87696/g.128275  ORF Transcript_87696/g.128275 Transcript_87696/m.128275 type:complete len:213 (-) Transcript_87696:508-1146(-)